MQQHLSYPKCPNAFLSAKSLHSNSTIRVGLVLASLKKSKKLFHDLSLPCSVDAKFGKVQIRKSKSTTPMQFFPMDSPVA